MENARILIVGGGIAGCSTAWHLGQRGESGVLLLERESTLGAHSSGRNAAILRTLTESALTTELALQSARFLAAPPAGFCEQPLVDGRGLVLVLGRERPPAFGAWRRRKGAAVLDLAPSELRALVPAWRGASEGALHVRDEGRIDIAELMRGFERGARRAGVGIRTGAAVDELLVEGGAVRGVRLAGGERILSERVALAAGGWAGELAAAAGSHLLLRPTRRHLAVTAPDPGIDAAGPVVWSDPDAFYARPESGGMLLCACDTSEVRPDACVPDESALHSIASKCERLLPALAGAGLAHFWAGLRSFSADGDFLIGPDPRLAGLHWIAALGGHGMSTAAAVGRIAAALLAGSAGEEPLAPALAPARFGRALASASGEG